MPARVRKPLCRRVPGSLYIIIGLTAAADLLRGWPNPWWRFVLLSYVVGVCLARSLLAEEW